MMTTTGGGGEAKAISLARIGEELFWSFIFGSGTGNITYLLHQSLDCNSFKGGYKRVVKLCPQLVKYGALASATFCTIDISMRYFRQNNDDGFNKIAMGAASAGLINVRPPGLGILHRPAMLYGAYFVKSQEVLYENSS